MPTIEGICNQALDMIGEKRHIGNISDGSTVSRVALNAWEQTRDGLLDQMAPIWAMKEAVLTLLKSAPNGGDYQLLPWDDTYPEQPWLYEYSYPADCVQPRRVKSSHQFVPNYRPRAVPFRLVFDASSDSRTILCNINPAILAYTKQVLDPNDWHNEFIDKMIMMLAGKFKAEFSDSMPQPQERGNANAAR